MTHKHLMLVEGKDDQHVVGYLLEHHDIKAIPIKVAPNNCGDKIVIRETGGVDSLLSILPIILDDGSIHRLAIVLDADTDLDDRWKSICKILNESGKTELPEAPKPSGTIIQLEQIARKLTVGIWIMPNNQALGILEDFIQWLIPENDDLWAYALQSVDNIGTIRSRFPEVRKSKAQIHTWLAWQKEPGKSLGTAMSAKYLDVQAKQSKIFVEWIRDTFAI